MTKIWPKEYFVDLGLSLIKQNNFTILLLGAKTEKEIMDYIYENINSGLPENLKPKIINTGINNSLFEFSALISMCNVFVTADTLGLHIAISKKA